MAATLTTLLSSPAGLPLLRSGSMPWKPEVRNRADDLRAQLAGVDPDVFARAVDLEMRRRVDALLTGLERYRHHPYHRDLPDRPTVWREGASRLLDFGGGRDNVPVLFVPSLVNRHYILDLSAERSLMRWLAVRGVRPLLLDWGRPDVLERRYTLTDYIAGRLERALDFTVARTGRPVVLAGYCMGGLLVVASALRRPGHLSGLVLLATPWDFHADDPAAARRTASALAPIDPFLDAWGELPVDFIQSLFASLDPILVARKFTRFAALDPDGDEARAFVALEDWLNDGVALPVAVARECLAGWYGRNDTAAGRWLVAGRPVDPVDVTVPSFAIIPERDRIVPLASARALARRIPGARTLTPPLGHIGMIVSAGADKQVWEPLAAWLRSCG
jgi:polyhydroxyalkanoate synthase